MPRRNPGVILLVWLVVGWLMPGACLAAPEKNGFDLADSLVEPGKIRHGGPSKDGIPAIDYPKFVTASEATFLADEDRVVGVRRNGVAKAYPIRILDRHELVNDRFAGEAILVSYCPLCGTAMVFEPVADGRPVSFGVSGLLYNSDVLFYDRATHSLWSQVMRKAISGPLAGQELPLVAASHTTWADWRSREPDTLVLSTDTGYPVDYGREPYREYSRSNQLWYPVENRNSAYRNKEMTLGLSINRTHKAYPFRELRRHGEARFNDLVGGQEVTIVWSQESNSARVLSVDGEEIPSLMAYWFAWYAFHPDTLVFTADEDS